MSLVPRCLPRAEPVPSRGKISVCPSFPWMGFLFHGTDGGSVVVVCCPNAGDAPAHVGWGRCLSKDCSSASQSGDQNGILPLSHLSKHPSVIPQSSVLSHMRPSASSLFSHILCHFPKAGDVQPSPVAASIPSLGSIPAAVWGTPSTFDD